MPHTVLSNPQCRSKLVWGGRTTLVFALLLMQLAASTQAQTVYRIVGADGKVTFSDKPPAAASQTTPLANAAPTGGNAGAALPFDLRQVAQKYPVTLYTSKDCAPCDSGRNLLRQRGVPFAEKTVSTSDDAEALQRLSGTTSLPFLTLGGQQIKGFSDTEWTQYLNAAGYPEKSRLPASYRNPAPAPLVAVKPIEATPTASAAPAAPKPVAPAAPPPRVTPANPAGIQF